MGTYLFENITRVEINDLERLFIARLAEMHLIRASDVLDLSMPRRRVVMTRVHRDTKYRVLQPLGRHPRVVHLGAKDVEMTKRNLGIGLLNGSFDFGKVLAVRHEQLLVLFGDFVQDRDVVDALEGFQTMLRLTGIIPIVVSGDHDGPYVPLRLEVAYHFVQQVHGKGTSPVYMVPKVA